jgi:preprotein translocase subunit SecG
VRIPQGRGVDSLLRSDPNILRTFNSGPKRFQAAPMVILLVIIHVIVCLFLIGVVLLQQGKSADLAGAFGGQGSQTAFGPRGAANLLTKLTTYSAIVFMLTSIGLTILLSRAGGDHSVLSGTAHPTHQTTPAKK